MGLTIEVGILADLLAHDPDGVASVEAEFDVMNQALSEKGFTLHAEPATGAVWSADLMGQYGLHALREVAGLVWQEKPLPRAQLLDGSETPGADALLATFLEHLSGKGNITLVGRALRSFFKAKEKPKLPPFVHLVVHSDCDGYYVPVEFELPLIPKHPAGETEHLWPLGSVLRLEKEINLLAKHLDLPVEMNGDDDALKTYLDSPNQAPDAPMWQAQPIAAHSCLVLREACHQSLVTGAAITFC